MHNYQLAVECYEDKWNRVVRRDRNQIIYILYSYIHDTLKNGTVEMQLESKNVFSIKRDNKTTKIENILLLT